MNWNWSDIEAALSKGLDFVQQLAPAAAIGGPQAGAIGKVVGEVAAFAQIALENAQAAGEAITSTDLASIQASNTALSALNDQLMEQIAMS